MTAEKFSNEDLRFQACLAFTLKYEGGRSNDPRDPGGRTMQGVTQATYDAYRAKKALGRKDVFTMSAAERDEIQRILEQGGRRCLAAGEDLCVFDLAVNSGPARARDVWQRCAGPHRLLDNVIHDICAQRLLFLHALRTWRYFGSGWGRRVAACEATAFRMAHGHVGPDVLARKADEARREAGKKATQATVGAAVSASGLVSHYLHAGASIALTVGAALALVVVAVFIFHAWRNRQRADALASAIADVKVQHEMLEQKTKAAVAEADVAGKEVAKKAQELAVAQKAISELGIKPVETKT